MYGQSTCFTLCRGQTMPAKYNRWFSRLAKWGREGGVLTRHQPGALDPQPQRLPMDRRHDLQRHQREGEEGAQQLRRVERAAAAIESCGEQGTFAIGLQDAQPDALLRRQDPEMVAHRHLDEGRDVEQFFLALPHAGIADLVRHYRQHVGMDIAKGVAHFVDHERQLAIGAIAEIDRQRIEGIAEQAGIAEQQHPPAGRGRCRARPRNVAPSRATDDPSRSP